MNFVRSLVFRSLLGAGVATASVGVPADGKTEPSAGSSLDAPAVVLPALEVKSSAYCNFGISVQAVGNPQTRQVSRLIITDVWENSEAEKQGLKPGDEILSINGIKVTAMKGGMQRGSDLFELLVNRGHGSRIKLEVEVRVVKRVTLTAG